MSLAIVTRAEQARFDMSTFKTVRNETLKKLQQFDSCTISNAVEQFHIRTRNEGFVNGSVRCLFPELAPVVGYAATARVRTSSTPISGRCYYDRMDWWAYVQTIPAPRFVVLEDIDHVAGLGALVGEIHATICSSFACSSLLTNGAIRDLPGVHRSGLQVFAGNVAVSHSYAHIVDFGEPIEIGGLQIRPGTLLHGDQHGVVGIPLDIAEEVPRIAARLLASEKELLTFCKSDRFSLSNLSEKIQQVSREMSIPGGETDL
jgi:regulator of RNase E activity RraA